MDMFNELDKKNKGYLDLTDFGVAFDAFRHQKYDDNSKLTSTSLDGDENKEYKLQVSLFQRLAIRRIEKRDRIYFGDAFVSLDNKNFGKI